MPRYRWICLVALALSASSSQAEAQMFGRRELGGFLSRQTPPGAGSNPAEAMIHTSGALTGTERFLRGNRRLTDYIGTDRGDQRHFIGVTQARPLNTPPFFIPPPPPPVMPEVNRVQNERNSAQQPYPPQLALSPELSGPAPLAVESALEKHLSRSRIRWVRPFEVSMRGRTAVLRGEVESEKDLALAEALVRFEPGVSDVQNDLRVARPGLQPVFPEPLPEPAP